MNTKTLEQKGIEHDIYAKMKLGFKLTERERAYYLLYMATPEQAKEFIKKEKKNEI